MCFSFVFHKLKSNCVLLILVYHGFELNFLMWNLGFGKATKKQPLNPDRAVELGADLIGEFFLYSFLVTIVLLEYSWSQSSSEKKKLEEEEFRNSMRNKLDEQSFAIATLEAEVRQMQRTIGELESSNFALMEKFSASVKKNPGWFKS